MEGGGTSGYHDDYHNYDDDVMVMLIMRTSFITSWLSIYIGYLGRTKRIKKRFSEHFLFQTLAAVLNIRRFSRRLR